MNERTHFLIKNIPLTLYSRKYWCWLCVRGELETGTDCYILTQSSSDHSSTSSSSWLGLLNRRSLGAQALCLELVLTPLASYLQIQLELTQAICDTWLYNCLTYTCFCLFTQVHLLIDSLVAGQYVTLCETLNKSWKCDAMDLQCVCALYEILFV